MSKEGNTVIGGLTMQSYTGLPYGVFPDVLCTSTVTYVAYKNSLGLCVYQFPNGHPEQATLVLQESEKVDIGFARLFQYKGKVLVAYAANIQPATSIILIDVDAHLQLKVTQPCVGNYPCCFGDKYLFYQKLRADKGIDLTKIDLDDLTESPATGNPAPTGLAYYDGTNVINMDQNRASVQGCFNPMRAKEGGALVGEDPVNGLFTIIGTKKGTINKGNTNNNPQCAFDGLNLTTVYWNPPEISNVFTILYNITAADIPDKPVIPLPAPPSKTKQRWIGAYFNRSLRYGDNPNRVGNITIIADEAYPIENLAEPLIVTHSVGDAKIITKQDLIIAYYAGAGNVTDLQTVYSSFLSLPEKPILAYIDGRAWPSICPSYFKKNKTWLGVQCYPNTNETPAIFQNAMEAILDQVSKYGLPIWLITCLYDRNFTLTLDQIEAVQYCYNLWYDKYNVIGELAFDDRRSGLKNYPQLIPYLNTRFDDTIRPTRAMYWSPDNDWRRAYLDALIKGDVLVKQGSQESLYTISLIKNNLGV